MSAKEPLYVNKSTLHGIKEFIHMQRTFICSQRPSYYDRILLLDAVLLVWGVIALGLGYKLILIITIAVAAVATIAFFTVLHNAYDAAFEQNKDTIDGVERTISFFDDSLSTISNEASVTISYSEIDLVIPTKEYWLIISESRLVQVKKGCFVSGDENSFEEFIIGKVGREKYRK